MPFEIDSALKMRIIGICLVESFLPLLVFDFSNIDKSWPCSSGCPKYIHFVVHKKLLRIMRYPLNCLQMDSSNLYAGWAFVDNQQMSLLCCTLTTLEPHLVRILHMSNKPIACFIQVTTASPYWQKRTREKKKNKKQCCVVWKFTLLLIVCEKRLISSNI